MKKLREKKLYVAKYYSFNSKLMSLLNCNHK